jgi:hypothetical protein
MKAGLFLESAAEIAGRRPAWFAKPTRRPETIAANT